MIDELPPADCYLALFIVLVECICISNQVESGDRLNCVETCHWQRDESFRDCGVEGGVFRKSYKSTAEQATMGCLLMAYYSSEGNMLR